MILKLLVSTPTVLAVMLLAGAAGCTTKLKQESAPHDHAKHDHAAQVHTRRDHATHGHAGHAHSGHSSTSDQATGATTAPAAQNYPDAVKQLRAHMSSLDAIIKSGDYDGVHDDCVAAGKLGDAIGALAAAQGSPVPKEEVSEVTGAGKELSSAARSLHKAAHNDDLARVKADHAQMQKLVESLAGHVRQP